MKTTFNESRRTFLALNSQAKSSKQCRLWVPKLPSPPKEPYMLAYIVIMEDKMETATVYWDFRGRMEKNMETNCRKHASLALLNASEIYLERRTLYMASHLRRELEARKYVKHSRSMVGFHENGTPR